MKWRAVGARNGKHCNADTRRCTLNTRMVRRKPQAAPRPGRNLRALRALLVSALHNLLLATPCNRMTP